MKKIATLFVITLFINVLFASPIDQINDWAQKQTGNFTSDDVVNFIKGNRAAGNISYGSEYVFNSGGSADISAASLDTSHFVVAYSDGGISGYGTAVIGSSISYGSE